MENLHSLREHVVRLLEGGQAYDTFSDIVAEFSADQRYVVPPGAEYSAWQILEHLRIALRDILDFSRNENGTYVELNWPQDYWPATPAPPDVRGWDSTINAFLADRKALEALVLDPKKDLFAPFPWGAGQTLLREALLAADHASYHLGQLVMVRRLLDS
ncbi:MAG TPA: DinB family protein [Chthonomonadaceae bacterium]|nr:DinB family protein [Chthonomonadaceae bacterium]